MPPTSGPPPVFDVLKRIAAERPPQVQGERCEMCGAPVADEHQHVVDVESRGLLCTCRPCYLLFTDASAKLRYRAVPDRYLSLAPFELGPGQWDALEIPVGLAFFFYNSRQERTVAFYPGPAGATESELPLGAWDEIVAANPALSDLVPDVEALLVRAPDRERSDVECYVVPVDRCYELVGHLRRVWRGFDGGQEAQAYISGLFDEVRERAR